MRVRIQGSAYWRTSATTPACDVRRIRSWLDGPPPVAARAWDQFTKPLRHDRLAVARIRRGPIRELVLPLGRSLELTPFALGHDGEVDREVDVVLGPVPGRDPDLGPVIGTRKGA